LLWTDTKKSMYGVDCLVRLIRKSNFRKNKKNDRG
jgi:hypothetical protein